MNRIDFEAKSDRELLILVAQKTNEVVMHLVQLNSTVARHESELAVLKSSGCCDTNLKLKILGIKWQTWAAVVAIIFGAIYGVGKACGWW